MWNLSTKEDNHLGSNIFGKLSNWEVINLGNLYTSYKMWNSTTMEDNHLGKLSNWEIIRLGSHLYLKSYQPKKYINLGSYLLGNISTKDIIYLRSYLLSYLSSWKVI